MADNINKKIPCGGFRYDSTAFSFVKDPTTQDPTLTLTTHVQTAESDVLILKSTESDQLYKITVDDAGTLKAEKFSGVCP